MTYEQAKKDFVLSAVFVSVKNKKGKTKLEQVDLDKENIPDDTEGRVGAFDVNQDYPLSVTPRLCFIVSEVDGTGMKEGVV